jgi:hypothetical protein
LITSARLRDQLRDRRDVLGRIVGKLGEQQRVDGQRSADGNSDRGAVGLGLGNGIGAEIAARSRLVLDHEGLSELLLQAVRDQARHHVRRGARPERHHDLDALRRPLLRRGRGRDEQRCRQCDGQSSLHRVSRAFGDTINKFRSGHHRRRMRCR